MLFFFFKQKTAYEMRISDWSSGRVLFRSARVGITDPLSISDYQAHEGFKGLEKALSLPPAAIVDQVTESGLRGRGGAAFPTGIKWKTVLATEAEQKYIVDQKSTRLNSSHSCASRMQSSA